MRTKTVSRESLCAAEPEILPLPPTTGLWNVPPMRHPPEHRERTPGIRSSVLRTVPVTPPSARRASTFPQPSSGLTRYGPSPQFPLVRIVKETELSFQYV